MRRARSALFALAVGGCHTGSVVEAPMISVDAAKTEATPAGRASSSSGSFTLHPGARFIGSYTCAQGKTDTTFTITDVKPDGNVIAVFEFSFEGDDDHDEATGSAKMRGHYEAKTTRLVLSDGEWIDRPGDYVLVDFDGHLSTTGSWTGRVVGPSCSTFDVHLDDSAEH